MTPAIASAALASPETKAAPGPDVADAFGEFMRAFDAFKATNDDRLVQLETRHSADVLTTDKLDRIEATLEEFSLKQARPHLSTTGPAPGSYQARQHRSAFEAYVRKGDTNAIRTLESKALSIGSGPDGGYLVPPETETTINRSLKAISPIRAIAGIRQVSGSTYKKPFSISGPATGWVAETAARPETAAPTLSELTFPTMELYAMPAASGALLDDAAVDIESWIADEVRVAFAEQEGAAFVNGNGVDKPKGFMTYPKVANASWSWGNTGYLVTGAAGAFPASNPSDKLIDLVHAVKAGYRANAHFVMGRGLVAEVRKLKDAQGNYLWTPAQRPGEPATLMGYPLIEAETMPALAADAYAIAFGDFGRGYLIVDRIGIRILRDPYSSKPYVLFYTTKRVGGGMQDFDAIKLLKFGTA